MNMDTEAKRVIDSQKLQKALLGNLSPMRLELQALVNQCHEKIDEGEFTHEQYQTQLLEVIADLLLNLIEKPDKKSDIFS